ncbi:MAG: ATPase [Deltaproteobacteria bacterium]|nr:MAG: ATPase [Deltaproteobacteria bacterium]
MTERDTQSTRQDPQKRAPYARTVAQALDDLGAERGGLNSDEAATRLRLHGPNTLPTGKPASPMQVILRQFTNPLIYILLAAALVSAAIGDLKDAGFILVVLALNATIGAFQEFRAERSAEALRSLVTIRAHVLRDGEELEVDARDLVPGDISVIESGAKVPADLRLVSGGLEIDESLLTGESLPVLKRADAAVARDAPLGDQETMAFAGTMVTRGRAYGVVVATASSTQLGRIASSLSTTDTAKPPLLVRMEGFTRKIALALAVAVLGLGTLMLVRGASAHEVFLASVTLAVSVIPEGLPVAMTVALAIAVRRMSRRNVIARRLAAVEALGSCTFIASDKTGTLTMNELTVKRVLLPGAPLLEVTGEGITPTGDVVVPGQAREHEQYADQLHRMRTAVALANDAVLAQKDGSWTSHGDSVDVAMLVLAEKLGVSRAAAEVEAPRRGSIPFEAERQFAATLNASAGALLLSVKGAGERVLPMCSRMATREGDVALDRVTVEARADELAAAGYRVLAIAAGEGSLRDDGEVDSTRLTDLVFLGFVGMIDPLRVEAPAAIRACRDAGIEVAMVTGDHPETALAIAASLGLATGRDQVVTGPALREALDADGDDSSRFDELVARSRVFARVEPQQKLEIVQSLIRAGHFVAVTGDGANDAPAMRAAHIGVAMGQRGTDVAKETGELILTDDDFSSIVAGIEEGRVAYGNVRKVIFLLISSGAAELVLFTLSIVTGLPLPLGPAQILWLNLVTNGIQDVALAFEPAEGGELARPPRSPREPIFDGLMLWRTALSAVVMGGAAFMAFDWMIGQGWAVDSARNVLLLLLVLFENVQAGNARSEHRSLLRLSPLRNPTLLVGTIIAQLLHIGAMHTPGLRDVLAVEPVSGSLWVLLLGIALSLFVVVELDKLVRRLWLGRHSGPRSDSGALLGGG